MGRNRESRKHEKDEHHWRNARISFYERGHGPRHDCSKYDDQHALKGANYEFIAARRALDDQDRRCWMQAFPTRRALPRSRRDRPQLILHHRSFRQCSRVSSGAGQDLSLHRGAYFAAAVSAGRGTGFACNSRAWARSFFSLPSMDASPMCSSCSTPSASIVNV